ncbi:Rv2732c family membrane protein [Corynebacterium macginleyi]|uniref:Rv2732c family membrane protein n=1 Tax=Corynebacterium macginleyi TaxID=38290 RepID=UPI00190AE77B|nr:hypothetical protein [Corynebacterium macginleyi]MBK4179231.1 hypothetical protein [Corynebacterium macginleyi]
MTERNTTTAAYQAAQAERRAAQTMDLQGQKLRLWISVAAYIVYLIVPYAGSAHGWQVLSLGTTDDGVKISLMETVSAWLALLGVGVLTTATLLTRRATFGLVAWMMVTVSLVVNLWGFWYRGSTADAPAVGMWVGMFATFLAFWGFSRVALGRSPEQRAAAEKVRASAGQLDKVGKIQSDIASPQPPAMLVDDRRKKAAERHRHQQQG